MAHFWGAGGVQGTAGLQVEMFRSKVLDGNGEVSLTLARAPLGFDALVVSAQQASGVPQNGMVCNVISLVGKVATVHVRKATYTPTGTNSAPAFTGNLGTTSSNQTGASAACIATCNQNHPGLGGHTHTLTPAGTVAAPVFTGSPNGLDDAAAATVTLVATYLA